MLLQISFYSVRLYMPYVMAAKDADYDKLLDKAYKELPDILKTHSRFEVPQVASMVQGKTTIISMGELAKTINRDPDFLTKYFLREFGTMGAQEGQRLVMKGQFRQPQVQEKFEAFLSEFVLCPECGRPDTKLLHERRINFLKCEACGARHSLRSLKTMAGPSKTTEISIGDEITVQITRTGKKGDGVAKVGSYIVFVNGAREGQRVRAKIKDMQRNLVFAELQQILG